MNLLRFSPCFLHFALCAMLFAVLPSAHALNINGYYGVDTIYKKVSDQNDRWEFQKPNHQVQMKIYANPYKGVDLQTEFIANSNESTSTRKFFLDKAWGKFWTPKTEIILLKSEERHFIDSPLLRLVDQAVAVNNNNDFGGDSDRDSQSIRINLFNFYRLRGNFIFTVNDRRRYKEWFGSVFAKDAQSAIAKLTYRAYEEKRSQIFIDIGSSYLRKDWQYEKFVSSFDAVTNSKYVLLPPLSLQPKNEVIAFESRVGFLEASWNTEVALSTSDGFGSISPEGERTAFSTEIRDLKLGNFLLRGAYFDYGKNFRSELSRKFSGRRVRPDGNNEFDRKGYSTQAIYFLEKKLVTVTLNRTEYITSFQNAENNTSLWDDYIVRFSSDYRVIDQSAEVVVLLKSGLQTIVGAENYKGFAGNFWSAKLEIKGENPVGTGKVQFRFKDVGSETGLGERFGVGVELKVNLTERLQILTRIVNVQSNFRKKNWSSSFGQLHYFVRDGFDIYFEYGEGNPTENLVFDGRTMDNDSRKTLDQVKLYFRINF